jgi:hypothetical protein
VKFPPGRARLAVKPAPMGSETLTNTTGIGAGFSVQCPGNLSAMGQDHVGLQGNQLFREYRYLGARGAKRTSMRRLRSSDHPSFSMSFLNLARRALVSGSSSARPIRMAMCRIRSGCCARATSGHAVAPPRRVMKSRRLICRPRGSRSGIVPCETSRLEEVGLGPTDAALCQ